VQQAARLCSKTVAAYQVMRRKAFAVTTPEPARAKALATDLVESSALPRLLDAVSKAVAAVSNFVIENQSLFVSLARIADDIDGWPEWQRELWAQAALGGWYINWHTPITINTPISRGKATLDAFMVAHLKRDWAAITSNIVSAVPERREILQCAFDLHTEKRYLASIPLFFAQADGICAEYVGAHLFTDGTEREARLQVLQASKGDFAAILLQTLGLQTQFTAGISKYSPRRKALAPNRNGILHGSRRHLDYGTETNSLKSLSLLAFVVFTLTGEHGGDA
jgi:hypothetical protein